MSQAVPQTDYESLKAAAFQSSERAAENSDRPSLITRVSPVISFGVVMALAACIGFAFTGIDYKQLTGKTGRSGGRHVVWRKMMESLGVDVEEYRAERIDKFGSSGTFANEAWYHDLQMFITDAMGPSD